jgi:hypothetical protein
VLGLEQPDPSINTLLDLDGSVFEQEGGFWMKIEAKSVVPTESIPHGVRYSLTLHNRYGTRVMGYDNAHAVKPRGRAKFGGQRIPYDHKHRNASDKGVPYTFNSAQELLEDFFAEVDRVIATARQGD